MHKACEAFDSMNFYNATKLLFYLTAHILAIDDTKRRPAVPPHMNGSDIVNCYYSSFRSRRKCSIVWVPHVYKFYPRPHRVLFSQDSECQFTDVYHNFFLLNFRYYIYHSKEEKSQVQISDIASNCHRNISNSLIQYFLCRV